MYKKIINFIFALSIISITPNFAMANSPKITEITPLEVNTGGYLTIKGNDFEDSSSNNYVYLNDIEVNPSEWSDSEIRIQINGDYFNNRKIKNIRISIRKEDDKQTLEETKQVSIHIKPIINFVWQVPNKDFLESGDLMFISGPLIKPEEDKIYIDDQLAEWDLSNKSPIPSLNSDGHGTNGKGFFKLPSNLSSANSIKILTSDGIESDAYKLSMFGHKIAPQCTEDTWECEEWGPCSSGGTQNRTCTKTFDCYSVDTPSPLISQSCTSPAQQPYVCYPGCDARTCVNGSCNQLGYMDATAGDKISLIGFDLNLTKKIMVGSTQIDIWSFNNEILEFSLPDNIKEDAVFVNLYGSKGGLIAKGTLIIRSKSKLSPPLQPTCTADTWSCGNWGVCSPQGIETRSCNKTFDCPSTETAIPATSQYCEPLNKLKIQTPTENLGITNQDLIIKSTVKLICPVNKNRASQGSGTIINSKGIILTNKHVINDTVGCLVGFINDYDDEPYFGERQIADIYRTSANADMAILKLRNPYNKKLTSIDITKSNSDNLDLGNTLTIYGYPAQFGTKIKYTSGDFSGIDGEFLQTTAIIEHGNSGGGAYLKNGIFIGMPTSVMKGDLNSMGYIIPINRINNWLANSYIAHNNNNTNNNYSRVSSILEDIDLNTLNSLDLYISKDDLNGYVNNSSNKTESNNQKIIEIDKNLSKKLKGKILLQVEGAGQAWYIDPNTEQRAYLGRPADAFRIMRELGLGIKHEELAKYLKFKFPKRLAGKILLDVEQNGEAYYVSPENLKGYYLKKPKDAFNIMRQQGLGITNSSLQKLPIFERYKEQLNRYDKTKLLDNKPYVSKNNKVEELIMDSNQITKPAPNNIQEKNDSTLKIAKCQAKMKASNDSIKFAAEQLIQMKTAEYLNPVNDKLREAKLAQLESAKLTSDDIKIGFSYEQQQSIINARKKAMQPTIDYLEKLKLQKIQELEDIKNTTIKKGEQLNNKEYYECLSR